uniref:VP3 n=1 Tax=Palyam virus TaxID=40059 RepID=A0A4P9JG05_9REOV|nr:VP3 [Palyam virus]
MDAQRTKDENKKEEPGAPYLDGDVLSRDNGALLSIFALQEIMQKVRRNQQELATHAPEIDGTIPEVALIIPGIRDLLKAKAYRVEKRPIKSFRAVSMQSTDFFLRVDTYYERISKVGELVDETKPEAFYETILKKIRHLRQEGAFLLQDIETHNHRGAEVAALDALGVEIDNLMPNMTTVDRQIVQDMINGMIIENAQIADRNVDVYMCAMSDPVYRVHNRLQGYIEGVQQAVIQRAIQWLVRLGQRKRIQFNTDFMTDFRRADTIWILTHELPPNANVIWEVPRSYITNLIMNIALCLPHGEYLAPNPRITSITITQRITQTNPFSLISGMTPTAQQMDDVKKIYLALMFPNQIILDLKADPNHAIDPVIRMVSGVIGHLMFTFGPRFTNITQTMATLLDSALNDFLLYMYNNRVRVDYGASGQPLDFHIGGRAQYDANRFRGNMQTGSGYNGWGLVDVEFRRPSPYDLVQRHIRYCDLDSREIIDPRTFGVNMNYPNYREMIRILTAAGKEQEAAFFRAMLPYHMIRFARLNQIINEDLLSGFSLPDRLFNAMIGNMQQGVFEEVEPITLEISWASIWFAFNRRFEPIARSELLNIAPMIESIYASELSIIQLDVRQLRLMRARVPEVVVNASPSQFWRAAIKVSPEPIKALLNLSQSFSFINVRDIIRWCDSRALQRSLAYELECEVWEIAGDFQELMLVNDVYFHRSVIPEPRLDDINEFRRIGFYTTNMLDAPPPLLATTLYTYEAAMLQANMGQFKAALRGILDDNGWVRFGGMLRNVTIEFFSSLPDASWLQSLPFEYKEEERDGLRYASIKYGSTAKVFYIIYNVDYSNTPDSLISINPVYTMTKIYMNKRIVSKVRVPDALSCVNKRVVSYKKKMRLMDVTEALKMGVQLAAPTV